MGTSRKHSLSLKPLGKILKSAVPIAVVCGVVSLFSALMYGIATKEGRDIARQKKVELKESYKEISRSIVVDNKRYIMVDENTLRYRYPSENPQFDHSYNFQTKTVFLDGPGKADRVLRFDEYKNDNDLADTLKIGCQIKANIPSLMAEFEKEFEEEFDGKKRTLQIAHKFTQKHCNDVRRALAPTTQKRAM